MWRGADTSAPRHFPFLPHLGRVPYCAFIVWAMLSLTHEHFFIHAAAEELRMVADMIGSAWEREAKAEDQGRHNLTVLQFLQLGYTKTKSPFIDSVAIYILNRYI